MRWIVGVFGLVGFLAWGAGCSKQCFLSEQDFYQAHHLPQHLERDADVIKPIVPNIASPADIDSPDRQPRFLSLPEAFAIALENGSPSVDRFGGSPQGLSDDSLVRFPGSTSLGTSLNGQTDRVRVLALYPTIASAAMEASLARFDAQWVTAMNWTNTDSLTQGLNSFSNGTRSSFNTSIVKAFSSGGVANITFGVDNQNLTNPPGNVINPLYTSKLTFGFEQPLWRDFGADINQLFNGVAPISGSAMPGTAAAAFNNKQIALRQVPSFGGAAVEGILISRLRFDASRAEFERHIHALLANVEVAYWNLYKAYGELYSFEEVLRLAHRAWLITQPKFQAGTVGQSEYGPILAQYEEFRGSRMQALGKVLDAERNLRGILGLPVEDCTRLVPITPPSLAPYCPDWCSALEDAINHRPELILARDNLRATQFNLIASENFLKPDLRFVASYSPTGFGNRLDGQGTIPNFVGTADEFPILGNVGRSLSGGHFVDWNLGLTLNIPLGYRFEHAAVRTARLGLAQAYMLLKDQEEKAGRVLAKEKTKITEYYRRIEAARNERKAYADAVKARFQIFAKPADPTRISVDALVEVQRRLALAQTKEYEAIAEYNSTLARFEHAKGTILQHNNVVIAEGSLPECVQVRAVEHERERSRALVIAERPDPTRHPGRLACNVHDLPEALDPDAPLPTEIGNGPADQRLLPIHLLGEKEDENRKAPVSGIRSQESEIRNQELLPVDMPIFSPTKQESATQKKVVPPAPFKPAGEPTAPRAQPEKKTWLFERAPGGPKPENQPGLNLKRLNKGLTRFPEVPRPEKGIAPPPLPATRPFGEISPPSVPSPPAFPEDTPEKDAAVEPAGFPPGGRPPVPAHSRPRPLPDIPVAPLDLFKTPGK